MYCYPLTVQDGATRFLLGCRGLLEPTIEASWPVFARLFRRYGLPERIRTDNGAPFASNALGRLSTLSVWWDFFFVAMTPPERKDSPPMGY